jgi:hypothetical protein
MAKKITTATMERRGARGNHVKDRQTRFKMIKYNGWGGMQAMARDRQEWRKTILSPVHDGL